MMRANGFTRNRATRRAACPLAYGGSANATSYCPECSCSANLRASTRCTAVRSSTLRSVMLALSDDNASRWISTKSALTAPRESASRPSAPEPANRSSTRAPRSGRWRMENHASRTRSPVGRTASPAGVFKRRPLNSPAIIRTIACPPPPPFDSHALGAVGAGLSHAEHRRRIARTARLEVADQLLQLVAHEAQRQLQVDPLGGHQVVGAQKLARDGEKRNTEC